MQIHGEHINVLRLQPGSKFQRNKSGFDTGVRTFKIDSQYIPEALPRIGDRDTRYFNMFVDAVDVSNDVARISTVTCNYKGVLGNLSEKKDDLQVRSEVASKRYVVTRTDISNETVTNVRYLYPEVLVFVDHVYVTDTQPRLSDMGAQKQPPIALNVPGRIMDLMEQSRRFDPLFVSNIKKLEVGWVLLNRDYDIAGDLFEVRDQYHYIGLFSNAETLEIANV